MSIGQPLTGERSSTPKFVDVVVKDGSSLMMKKMGNGHLVNFMWTDVVSMSGTEYTLASGISYHGKAMASYANITATPRSEVSVAYYINYDTTNNIVKLMGASSIVADFNIQIVLA